MNDMIVHGQRSHSACAGEMEEMLRAGSRLAAQAARVMLHAERQAPGHGKQLRMLELCHFVLHRLAQNFWRREPNAFLGSPLNITQSTTITFKSHLAPLRTPYDR